ncbi:MAG: antirestriction protein ArdA [Cohaesibacteraceae bacterium]
MTIKLYAQPYDISATGFFFSSISEYEARTSSNRNRCGDLVEEYEIQFIEGERIDCALASAWRLSQANFAAFLEKAAEWNDDQKTRFVIAVSECGYSAEQVEDDPCDLDLDIHDAESLSALAEQFVEEGLFGDIPERLACYLDYDAMARDLSVDYTQTEIAGERYVYRCA